LALTNATGTMQLFPCLPPRVFWEVPDWTLTVRKGGTESCMLPYGPAASTKQNSKRSQMLLFDSRVSKVNST